VLKARPVAEWLEIFGKADVMCAPINDMAGAFADPQIRHREMVVEVPHETAGTARLIRSPVRMSETPLDDYRAPPLMGEHTDSVLMERLGLDQEEIQRLRAERWWRDGADGRGGIMETESAPGETSWLTSVEAAEMSPTGKRAMGRRSRTRHHRLWRRRRRDRAGGGGERRRCAGDRPL